MSRKPGAKPHGQIRQSQVVTTFGPGAMLDLPKHSVLVGGLDYWSKGGEEIIEPRLTGKLAQVLEVPTLRLLRRLRRNRKTRRSLDRHRLLSVPGVVHHPGCRIRRSAIAAAAHECSSTARP